MWRGVWCATGRLSGVDRGPQATGSARPRHWGANHGSPGEPDMLDRSLEAEFEGYRKTLSTDEARRAFDELIERLLGQHGVDYVRGYVDALKDASS
jgi:hypothetical protein